MRVNVKQFGITVDYNPSGSSAGRKNFLNGTVDFAASDIPFQFEPEDGSAPENPAPGSYAYIPVTAGGTAFMYNLKINGQRVTNLRLSGENVAKIFTGAHHHVERSGAQGRQPGPDAAGAQGRARRAVRRLGLERPVHPLDDQPAPGHLERLLPSIGPGPGLRLHVVLPDHRRDDRPVRRPRRRRLRQSRASPKEPSATSTTRTRSGARFPVAKVLNAAGYYTEPTPENVAVSLLKARINTDESYPRCT